MEDSEIRQCLTSYKVHDISRFLKDKFKSFDSDLIGSLAVSCSFENAGYLNKSNEICAGHHNVVRQANILEKNLLEQQLQVIVDDRWKVLESNVIDGQEERTSPQLSLPRICSNENNNKKEQENQKNKNTKRFRPQAKRSIVKTIGHSDVPCQEKRHEVDKMEESGDVFDAIPVEVVFQDYEIGQVYEINLVIRNVGHSCRMLRVIPPRTPFFSIGLGQFPSCTGSIAPGLHCTFAIKFCPDSLANFEDCISVEVEHGNNLNVPLKAIRPPPVLKMPACFHMEDCLVGQMKSKKFMIKNEGSYGKFCFVPECRWPAVKLKTLLLEDELNVGESFELKTIYFELSRNATIEVEVTFCPKIVGRFCESLLIVCDNCQVKKINVTGGGVTPRIELLEVEGGWSCYCENEMKDVSASHLLRFPNVNPHSTAKKRVTIKNCINVDVPYYWVNYYSEFKRVHRECDDDNDSSGDDDDDPPSPNTNNCNIDGSMERRIMPNSKFSVEPKSGIFPACGIVEFYVTFSPEEIGKYQEVVHFDVEFDKNVIQECDAREETSQTLELIGFCSPHQVFMHPRVLLLPVPIPIQVERKRSVKIVNKSSSKVSFKWENITTPYSLTMSPASGYAEPASEQTFELILFSNQPHPIDHNLCCCVDDKECLLLRVVGEFMAPRLEINKQKINFGLISPGQIAEEVLLIRNPSSAFISWFIHADESMDFGDLTILPDFRGSLRPHEEQKLTFTINTSVTGRIHHFLKLSSYMGDTSTCFEVEAEIQVPLVCLEKFKVELKDVRPNNVEVVVIKLINQTAIRAFYKWKNISKDSVYTVNVNPGIGSIEPRGSFEFKVTFLSFQEGTFHDIIVPCKIQNSSQCLFLCVSAEVKKPQVSFYVQILDDPRLVINDETSCESMNAEIDFGLNNEVGSIARKYLVLTSESLEEVEYDVDVLLFRLSGGLSTEEYKCLNDVENEGINENERELIERQRKCLRKRLFERPGSGAMFVAHPSCGTLPPRGRVVVLVAALSDTFGVYSDTLLCRVGSVDLCLPISYGAEGGPVYFQMMSSSSSSCSSPNLWFGKFYRSGEVITRHIEIVNSSSIDVTLDWNIALKSNSDSQVVTIVPDFERTSGEKVIKLNLLTHKGLKTSQENPFQICPKVSMVPAKSRYTFEFKFTPPSCRAGQEEVYTSIASAFIIIENDCDRQMFDNFIRKDRYDLNTLDLNLHAEIVIPKLSIWHEQDEGLRFVCTAGDLLLECSDDLKDHHMELSNSYIVNERSVDVLLEISTNDPFGFSIYQNGVALPGIEPRPKEGSKYFGRSNILLLKPGTRLKAKFMFYLVPAMLKEDSNFGGGRCCEDEFEKKLHFMDNVNLKIVLKCGDLINEQNLPLYATVVLPKLRLSNDDIDFGPCYLGQSMTKIVSLTNTSSSACRWMIDPCVCNKFSIFPTCGMFGKTKKEKTIILEISFMPIEVSSYESCFTVTGTLEESPIRLTVSGSGVVDEHFMH